MKRKTIKLDKIVYDILQRARNEMQEKTDGSVSFTTTITALVNLRNFLIVKDDGKECKFSIGYREFDKVMIPFEVCDYRVVEYDDEKRVSLMIEPNYLVIPDEKIRVLFDYPLSHSVEKIHEKKGGFSRLDILKIVGEGYAEIYKQEESSMKEIVKNKNPSLVNRGTSDGVHGIWGHVIGDLHLEFLSYDKKAGVLRLWIGS